MFNLITLPMEVQMRYESMLQEAELERRARRAARRPQSLLASILYALGLA